MIKVKQNERVMLNGQPHVLVNGKFVPSREVNPGNLFIASIFENGLRLIPVVPNAESQSLAQAVNRGEKRVTNQVSTHVGKELVIYEYIEKTPSTGILSQLSDAAGNTLNISLLNRIEQLFNKDTFIVSELAQDQKAKVMDKKVKVLSSSTANNDLAGKTMYVVDCVYKPVHQSNQIALASRRRKPGVKISNAIWLAETDVVKVLDHE